jgi:hypothetical protein
MRLRAAVVAVALTGCAHTSMLNLSPDEQSGLERAMAHPTSFTVAKDEAPDAWGRAQSFVGRFSSMKLQTATDFVIQTYNPTNYNVAFGYYVTRTPVGAEHQIDVQCVQGNPFSSGDGNTNAHIAALYIATGELACPRCIAR